MMTSHPPIERTTGATCPNCGAATQREDRVYYCRRAHPNAPFDDILGICIRPDQLQAAMKAPDIEVDDDPYMECRHFSVMVEDPGTFEEVVLVSDEYGFSITETHRCKQCGTIFRFDAK